jgi:pyridoxamine 5'-phosphate oxidase
MMDEIVERFQACWRRAGDDPSLRHKGAACVSTIDESGYPAARFVDLKSVTDDGLTFCTDLDSGKGVQIERNPRVAVTLWWENVGCQVRVQGAATPIARSVALEHWQARSREAQLTTLCSRQSEPLLPGDELPARLAAARDSLRGIEIPMPDNWGGFVVRPISVEFLTFRDDRLHLREHYFLDDGRWSKRLLQP